jgi:hypothetical protein
MEIENEICPRCKDMHYPMTCSVSIEGQTTRIYCSNCAIDLVSDLNHAEKEWEKQEPWTSAVNIEGQPMRMYHSNRKVELSELLNKFEHELDPPHPDDGE